MIHASEYSYEDEDIPVICYYEIGNDSNGHYEYWGMTGYDRQPDYIDGMLIEIDWSRARADLEVWEDYDAHEFEEIINCDKRFKSRLEQEIRECIVT